MISFVINLDTSTDRWVKYKEKGFHRWRATTRDEVDELTDKKMISFHNYPRHKHLGRCACFLSHMKLLKHIVDNQLNDVLILEDDAVKCDEILTGYPKNGLTYVGGWAHHKKMMDNSPVYLNTNKGHHIKDDNIRILMTMSYIIPTWTIADTILKTINKKKRFRAIDIMYDDLPVPIYYQYPASYVEQKIISTIDPSKKKRADQFYQLR